VNQPTGSGTEPAEITDEQIYEHLRAYQEAGMVEYVLPTEPLGVQWIIGYEGQILKFLTKEGILGFLMGIQAGALYVNALKESVTAPLWEHPAWGAESRQVWADRAAEVTKAVKHFTGTWAELMASLPDDYGCEMTCAEANAAAGLYRALGDDTTAALIITAHGDHDEEGDQHWHGAATAAGEEAS